MPQRSPGVKELAPKVPQITLLFWIVKVLTTGMGESMSDFMGSKSVPIAGAVGVLGFALAMRLQLRARRYSAPVYWFAVMMVAVFGTMVADGIKDGLGLSYAVTTPVFALAVAAVFRRWHRREGTLSVHSIAGGRRERFYWAAVLGTFALGTAAGDLTAMTLHLGYFASILVFGVLIALPAVAWARGRLNPIAAFWLSYILTRPLGASIADWLGKPDHGGLGRGDGAVSGLALIAFLGLVAYLTAGGRDVQPRRHHAVGLRPQVAEE
jgi:uncharacterized membrane-anchored protein